MRIVRRALSVMEAFQMTFPNRVNNEEWPEWMHQAWNTPHHEIGSIFPSGFPESDGKDKLYLRIPVGPLTIEWGDYIIKERDGNVRICKQVNFEDTYMEVV